MIGDDACSTFVEILKKLMDIAGSIAREQERRSFDKKAVKAPKIKVGKLSKKEFNKLQQAGREFKYMTVSANDLSAIEENMKKMGGSFFDAHLGENNTHVIAVPASQVDLLQMASMRGLSESAKNNEVKIKDGGDLIEAEDVRLVRDVMNRHDIPVVSFKTNEGKYMNVVPTEFDGQYSKALKEADEIKKELSNINIVRYDQTAPLDKLDRQAETVSPDDAKALAADDPEMEFVKQENGDIAILYKTEYADRVKKAREEYAESLKDSEEYLIDVMDNVITLGIEKLMIPGLCNDESIFMKVPNTHGQDHITAAAAVAKKASRARSKKTKKSRLANGVYLLRIYAKLLPIF